MSDYVDGYENLDKRRDKSISGSSARCDKNRTVKMKYRDFSRCVRAVAAATAIATTITIGAGSAIVNKFKEGAAINRLRNDFQVECISPETHRTMDNQHYFYDYDDIADYIEGMDDFDTGVYLMNICTNDTQTDRVMRYTTYGSFESFLESNSYKDSDDFRDVMRGRLAQEDEVRKMMADIEQTKSEHSATDEFGGVK